VSKIVDALRKIQDDRPNRAKSPRKIAKIEPTGVHKALDETDVLRPDQLEAGSVLQIDEDAMREAGLIAPVAEQRLFEDEYRVIKRPIIANAFGKRSDLVENGYAVLVSSALSGDGKTFTCINLALSIAREQDVNVVLVDADTRKPHISSLFDARHEKGLLDYLDGSVESIGEIELPTSAEGLSVIPSGTSKHNATELLSGRRMSEFFEDMHARYPDKLILIDSSPLLQTTESPALVSSVGQIVVVVQAGVTSKVAVTDALATLDQTKPVNLVLNQVRHSKGTGYYGGYFDGDYGSDFEAADENQSNA
jgi:exopolysaccharide/PEP-CTERM locus tyrosine autokinase